MEFISIDKEKIVVTVSQSELAFLNNAVNEILGIIPAWEFQTRTGETTQAATTILGKIRKILDSAT